MGKLARKTVMKTSDSKLIQWQTDKPDISGFAGKRREEERRGEGYKGTRIL